MKLLKTIGKILAIPFDLIAIIGKILLVPAAIISKLLNGGFEDYSFLITIGYNKEGEYYEQLERFTLSKGGLIHSTDYVKTK